MTKKTDKGRDKLRKALMKEMCKPCMVCGKSDYLLTHTHLSFKPRASKMVGAVVSVSGVNLKNGKSIENAGVCRACIVSGVNSIVKSLKAFAEGKTTPITKL